MRTPYRDIWSALREPLQGLSFAHMKDAASAAGLDTARLSHLYQGLGGVSKGRLAEGIDSLFNALDEDDRDQVTIHMAQELATRLSPPQLKRFDEILNRIGWHLVVRTPIPIDLRLDLPLDTMSDYIRESVMKATYRYLKRDFAGAMTTSVGIVDDVAKSILEDYGISVPNIRRMPYHQRVIEAHKITKSQFLDLLIEVTPEDADRVWISKKQAVNSAANLLATFRRQYSDVHGPNSAKPILVRVALNSAFLLLYNLTDWHDRRSL